MSQQEIDAAIAWQRFTHEICANRAHNDSDPSVKANMERFMRLARIKISELKGVVVVG